MTIDTPLTLLEEFLLLALDDRTGEMYPLDKTAFDCATAGAVLMDLTLRGRIDNDLRDMFVVDSTPTGDDILDPVLQVMSLSPVLTPHPIAYWLRQSADEAVAFREKALHRLEKRGIVKRQGLKILWPFGTRRYPLADGKERREVKRRLTGAILSEEIPTPRDIMITGLAQACGLFGHIFDETVAAKSAERIGQIALMDLIGQAVAKGVSDVSHALSQGGPAENNG